MLYITENGIRIKLKVVLKKISCCCLFLASVLWQQQYAFCDGWTQEKGRGLLIFALNTSLFNGINSLGEFDESKKVLQLQPILYGEYGLMDRFTLGGKVITNYNLFSHNNSFLGRRTEHSIGLNSSSVFGRLRLFKSQYFVFSISGEIQSPSYYKDSDIAYYGLRVWQYLSKMEFGFNIFDDFLVLTVAWQGNIKHWYNELHFELTYGHYFIPELLLLVRFQKFIYFISNKDKAQNIMVAEYKSVLDFLSNSGFAKISISLATNLTKNMIIEFGVYSTISAKFLKTEKLNIGMRGFFTSLWYYF